MNRGQWHESLVYVLNQPVTYALFEMSRWRVDAVYIPRVGYVVSDAEIARQLLTDSEHFDSHSQAG